MLINQAKQRGVNIKCGIQTLLLLVLHDVEHTTLLNQEAASSNLRHGSCFSVCCPGAHLSCCRFLRSWTDVHRPLSIGCRGPGYHSSIFLQYYHWPLKLAQRQYFRLLFVRERHQCEPSAIYNRIFCANIYFATNSKALS